MKCEVCGKGYKSKSGLRRHVKAKHGADGAGDGAAGEVATEEEAGPSAAEPMEGLPDVLGEVAEMEERELRRVCELFDIKVQDVMAFKVYDDKVVIIEGPTGWKRVCPRE